MLGAHTRLLAARSTAAAAGEAAGAAATMEGDNAGVSSPARVHGGIVKHVIDAALVLWMRGTLRQLHLATASWRHLLLAIRGLAVGAGPHTA